MSRSRKTCRTRRRAIAVALIAVALGLAGCAGGSDTGQPNPRPTTGQSAEPGSSKARLQARAQQELADGLVAYNPPGSSVVHEQFQVTARIQRGSATVQPSLTALPGQVTTAELPVGTYLRADLDGANFAVEPIGEEFQSLIDDDGYAEWAWKVDPLTEGALQLRLTVYVELDGEPLSNRVFDHAVEVRSADGSAMDTMLGWSGWGEVLAGLIVAAITATAGWFLTRRRRPDASRPDSPE